ncbi:glycosyltransferase family 9 protein [Actinokineospora sp. 24-640]
MILVLRALKLGDLLVAVPALRGLRAHWPDEEIVLACLPWLSPIIDLTGAVDRVLPVRGLEPLPPEAARPAVAVNMHGAGPTSTAILDDLDPGLRIGHEGHGWQGPAWRDDLPERERWCGLLSAHGIPAEPNDLRLRRPPVPSPAPGAVVIHPGAAYGSKRWPPARFAEVATWFGDRGHRVVITGTAAEHDLAAAVAEPSGAEVLAGKTSLHELAALIADAAVVVTGDTGTAHLSYAYATPSVVLFGPVGPEIWGPPATGPHTPLTVAHLSRPDEPFADDPDPALLAVTVDDVLAALPVTTTR